ncbi:hypothetical protein BDV98DRAFT_569070 [Pterulicium gracile]|uniref:RNAse P Rpr2/Rpp21/SNM1 subunit domain-containing protein n=1 Tax=Pterulicium gracile TaxID=1884261 RepID=A0A5C3QJ47_9AGAR|nr:hypothetical protein BDV98DRAFT_569070 [Pterula gracilis]
MQQDDSLTSQFQSSAAFVVPSSLRATHAHRAHLLSKDLVYAESSREDPRQFPPCTSCGSFLFGTRTSRTSATRPRIDHEKLIIRTCAGCGLVTRQRVASGTASQFPAARRHKAKASTGAKVQGATTHLQQRANRIATAASTPVSISPSNPKPTTAPPIIAGAVASTPMSLTRPSPTVSASAPAEDKTGKKSRTKKKGGLQDMLARNRNQEREKQSQDKKRTQANLGDFLSSLS